ncbi:MAG: hypothetical protein G3M70_10825 [Candidatus Nitronauta litoralis]|uniref:Uncharacterized protein n=1 Tax=Candidatus Nitronauta litoralis TaxID=2705533 RepID=A0A7T0BZG9_9BACT|nr:MAG: hypothetical protein G3M70_10825 [Candidatus Nitronauta litoralis]
MGTAWAEPTNITVRVISKDAKFIGTSMGGALITLRDAQTGEVLAKGTTLGTTGNVNLIMKKDRKRGVPVSSEGSAKFSTTLDLMEPRLIEVTAIGPQAQRQSANRVSATQWVVPGKHITDGDGWLLEMPGFAVDVLAPPVSLKLKGAPKTVEVKASVRMMCGCPIKPDGLWDANHYEVTAMIKKDGKLLNKRLLSFAGKTSLFAGTIQLEKPGTYEIMVYAYDPRNGNTGLDSTTLMVVK